MLILRTNKMIIKYVNNSITVSVAIFILVHALVFGVQSATETVFYKGAAVEYAADSWNGIENPKDLLLRNAKRYTRIIQEAGKEKCDIIVFPECGLTSTNMPIVRDRMYPFLTFIPGVEEKSIPCQDNTEAIAEHLREVSCAAQKHNIYVVINLYEKVKCDVKKPGCPSDGLMFYNTNVVFNREGEIIAKYHKFNLFGENEINSTSTAELITFDTDFGVRFGTFICFDILFTEPSAAILKRTGVTDIVYSTAWLSELPFLTAVQTQAGYSYLHNVNFLASGYNLPKSTMGGSGIFAGVRGPLVAVMPDQQTTKLLIAKLSSNINYYETSTCHEGYSCAPETKVVEIHFNDDFYRGTNKAGFNFFHQDLSGFSTEILGASETSNSKEVSNNERVQTFTYSKDNFHCEIKTKWFKKEGVTNTGPVYRHVGFSGERSYSSFRTVRLEVCGLIACQNEDIKTCGWQPDFNNGGLTTVKSVLINTNTSYVSNPLPVTLDKNILALKGNYISFTDNVDRETGIQSNFMVLEKPRDDLITFGIYKS